MVEGTGFSIGTLGKGTGIILMVGAAIAQKSVSRRLVQGNTGMTIGFENITAVGTDNRLSIDGLVTAGTIGHFSEYYQEQKHNKHFSSVAGSPTSLPARVSVG